MRFFRPAAAVVAVLAAVLLAPRPGLAWGPEGHRVVALLADHLLRQADPAAHAKLAALLATDKGDPWAKPDIASQAEWADVLREKSEEARGATTPWHSARLKADGPDLTRDCFGRRPLPEGYPASHGPRSNCSVDKILQFEAELKDPATAPGERLAAVQFLLNLVGDLNDPMHAIDHADQGGRCVALQVGAKPPVRLSSYWQETLVGEVAGPDAARGAQRLAASIPVAQSRKWAEGGPEAWAQETYEVAKTVAYSFAGGPPSGKVALPAARGQPESCPSVALYRVGLDYETKALAATKEQLARAGVRLAAILNDSLR